MPEVYRFSRDEEEFLLKTAMDLFEIESSSDASRMEEISPTTPGQMEVAEYIQNILERLGLAEINLDTNGYLTACLPSNLPADIEAPTIALLAHTDTDPTSKGPDGVNPKLHGYQGGDLVIGHDQVLTVEDYPYLPSLIGQQIVSSDGTSSLGADCKAGIAEILTMLVWYSNHPEVCHGPIKVAFFPDEEVEGQAKQLNIEGFADFAYTVDGSGPAGNYTIETFNGYTAHVDISCLPVFPGDGKKHGMVNAMNVAARLIRGIEDLGMVAETTEKREPYISPMRTAEWDFTQASLQFMLRSFDLDNEDPPGILQLKARVRDNCNNLQLGRYKDTGTKIEVRMEKGYHNLHEKLRETPEVIERMISAIRSAGFDPVSEPARGGLDICGLIERGLPGANVSNGSLFIHSNREIWPLNWGKDCTKVLIHLTAVPNTQ